jgi:hypothetical protein
VRDVAYIGAKREQLFALGSAQERKHMSKASPLSGSSRPNRRWPRLAGHHAANS